MLAKTEPDTSYTILNKAADLIEEKGWWNGKGDADGKHCALSSIWYSLDQRYEAANKLVKFLGVKSFTDVRLWNDTPGRKAQEVIDALRSAAYEVDI